MQKKFFTVLLAIALIICFTTACTPSLSLVNSGKGYDGFEYLSEASLVMNNGKVLKVFIPKMSGKMPKSTSVSSSGQGVDFTVSILDKSTMASMDNSIKKYMKTSGVLSSHYLNAAEQKIDSIKMSGDDSTGSRTGFVVLETQKDKYDAQCITTFVTKLDDDTFVEGTAVISSTASTKKTQDLIDELHDFYKVDFYNDADKAKKATKKYTKNPIKTKEVRVGNLSAKISKTWSADSKKAGKSSNVMCFGPKGKTTAKENLYFIINNVEKKAGELSDAAKKAEIKNMIPGSKEQYTEQQCSIDGGSAMMVTSRDKKNHYKGYCIFYKNELVGVYTVSKGSVTSEMDDQLNSVFESFIAIDN